MGTLKKSMPDDAFQGKRWKHSPPIYQCISCGARGVSGFRETGLGPVCDKKVCLEKLNLVPAKD